MIKKSLDVCTTRGFAHKALACMTSIVLAIGLMPGIALADDVDSAQYVDHGSVTIDGNIDVKGGDDFWALDVSGLDDNAKAEVTGSVNLENGNYQAKGVDTNVNANHKAEAVVGSANGGNVTVTSTHDGKGTICGVHAQVGSHVGTNPNGAADVTVNGNVVVQNAEGFGKENSLYGVNVNNVSGQANITVKDVTVGGDSLNACCSLATGIYSNTETEENASAVQAANATAKGINATGLSATGQGTETIAVTGDVKATAIDGEAIGIFVDHSTSTGGVTVLVEGTVNATGARSAGVFAQNDNAENLDVTVWQIVKGERGVIASSLETDGGFAENEKLESKINYIIKVKQPTQGNILSLSGTAKKNIVIGDKTYSYDVANWGNGVDKKVYLQAAEGWVITGGYSDEGKSVALKHDDGGWYVVVPNGGGVYLTAQVAKQQFDVTFKNGQEVLQSGKVEYGEMPSYTGATPTKDPTTEIVYEFAGWKPVLDKVTGDIVYEATFTEKAREYMMSFDLDGGTVDGKTTVTIAAAYGSIITLMSPVRDGYEFQYWEGSRYYAGDPYKVEGPHSFKAIWKKKEPTPTPEPTSKGASKAASTNATPATGDGVPVAPVIATMLVSAVAFVVGRKKLQIVSQANRGRCVR